MARPHDDAARARHKRGNVRTVGAERGLPCVLFLFLLHFTQIARLGSEKVVKYSHEANRCHLY